MFSGTDSYFQTSSASYMKMGQESSWRILVLGPFCGVKGKKKKEKK